MLFKSCVHTKFYMYSDNSTVDKEQEGQSHPPSTEDQQNMF